MYARILGTAIAIAAFVLFLENIHYMLSAEAATGLELFSYVVGGWIMLFDYGFESYTVAYAPFGLLSSGLLFFMAWRLLSELRSNFELVVTGVLGTWMLTANVFMIFEVGLTDAFEQDPLFALFELGHWLLAIASFFAFVWLVVGPQRGSMLSNPRAYVWLIVSLFIVYLLAIVMIGMNEQEIGVAIMVASLFPAIASQIFLCVLLYRVWRFIIAEQNRYQLPRAISSPGTAVGLLFIPFFNLYWFFRAAGGAEKALGEIEQVHHSEAPARRRYGNAYAACLLASIIPYLGALFSLVGLFIVGPLFVSNLSRTTDDLAETAGYRT